MELNDVFKNLRQGSKIDGSTAEAKITIIATRLPEGRIAKGL
jgi:hypothetical protein